jgi:hypothetical protein
MFTKLTIPAATPANDRIQNILQALGFVPQPNLHRLREWVFNNFLFLLI